MSVLLLILKIIGITLLALLALILLSIMLLVFVPIRYKGSFKKSEDDNELSALAVVTWLLSIVRAKVSYDKGKPLYYELRVFGIRIFSSIKKEKERPSKKEKSNSKQIEEKTRDSKDRDTDTDLDLDKEDQVSISKLSNPESGIFTIEEADSRDALSTINDIDAGKELNINESIDLRDDKEFDESDISNDALIDDLELDKKHRKSFIKRIKIGYEKLKKVLKKLFSQGDDLYKKTEGFINKINREYRFYNKFLTDERNKKAFDKCLKKIIRILKSVKPKIKGNLTFGTDDPASTGNILIFLSALYPVLPKKFEINPRFDEKILRADLSFKGKIRIYILIGAAISIYFDKNFKRMVRIYNRHKGK